MFVDINTDVGQRLIIVPQTLAGRPHPPVLSSNCETFDLQLHTSGQFYGLVLGDPFMLVRDISFPPG